MMSKPESKTTRADWMLAGIAFLLMLVAVPLVISQLAPNAPEPVAPRLTLSEGLQDALLFLGLCVVAVGALLTYMGRVARRSARTADTPREGNGLQAQLHVMRAERDKAEWERDELNRRVKELERAEAMYHKAMLSKQEELDKQAGIIQTCRMVIEAQGAKLDAAQISELPLDVTQALALMRYARSTPALTVRGARELIRAEGIALPNSAYAALSAFVKEANTLPHQQAQPVRAPATEKRTANARRERANGRTRTHPRTRKQ